jgi:hypothetical protein
MPFDEKATQASAPQHTRCAALPARLHNLVPAIHMRSTPLSCLVQLSSLGMPATPAITTKALLLLLIEAQHGAARQHCCTCCCCRYIECTNTSPSRPSQAGTCRQKRMDHQSTEVWCNARPWPLSSTSKARYPAACIVVMTKHNMLYTS